MNYELKVHWSVVRKDGWVRLTEYTFLNNIIPTHKGSWDFECHLFYFYLYFSYPFY